jgi:Zn finger protein HypA/HybF involved in hydrogenase expression
MPVMISCLDCRRPTEKHRSGRCPTCRSAKRASYGWDRADVRKVMRAVVDAAGGRCAHCGKYGRVLHAHFVRGGEHLPYPEMYLAVCEQCHPAEEKITRAALPPDAA